jgi:hypothetical protein
MPQPRLLHPVTVIVEQFDASKTIYDPDSREPVKQAVRKQQYTLPGQAKWGVHDEAVATELGLQDREAGYVLFRVKDANTIGYTPKRLDRIIRIGILTGLDLYIDSIVPLGHYPDRGGHSLFKCLFVDKAPVSNG